MFKLALKARSRARTIGAAIAVAAASWAVPAAAADDPEVLTIGVIPFEEVQVTAEKFKGVVERCGFAAFHFSTHPLFSSAAS